MSLSPSLWNPNRRGGFLPDVGTRHLCKYRQIFNFCSVACRHCFMSVVLGVQFRRFCCVMGCVVQVSLCRVRVVSGCLVVASLVVTGGFAMVPRRMFVVLRCLVMVLCCLFRHGRPLFSFVDCSLRTLTVSPVCYGNVSGGLSFKQSMQAGLPGNDQIRTGISKV
jgi:hypothetical protein